jgi:hypothetical protein
MDATLAVNTSKKTLDSLRAVPLWLLVAFGLVGLMIWSIPSFHATVPEALQPYIPLLVAITAVLVVCSAAHSAASHVRHSRRVRTTRDRLRLIRVYRPLVSLFLTRHLTGSGFEKAPHFRDRLENAWHTLRFYRRRNVAVKEAFRALFDRQPSTSFEVEFGGVFPLTQIMKLIRHQPAHADPKLLNLVRIADRSRYEECGSELLTDAEMELFEHIYAEHDRLSRKLG